MDIYIKIDGGIGRVIASTGVVEAYAKLKKEEGIKVNVISSYPQIFWGLDYVNRVYDINMPYLYEDYIAKGEFIEPEPYNHYLYYKDNEHLATVFNFILTGKKEFIQPKVTLNEVEKSDAKGYIDGLGNKPVMLIQPWSSSGGILQENGSIKLDESYRSFSLDFYNKLIETYKDKYRIISVQAFGLLNGQQVPQYSSKEIQMVNNPDIRKIIALIPHADVMITCDSFLHHASASLNTPVKTIVLWGGTSEKSLGYEGQVNIKTAKEVIYEPNRVPHDHNLYLNHNKGANDFDIEDLKSAV